VPAMVRLLLGALSRQREQPAALDPALLRIAVIRIVP